MEKYNNEKIECLNIAKNSCSTNSCNIDGTEYSYNENTKSCFYANYHEHTGDGYDFYIITDVTAGQVVYWCTVNYKEKTSTESYSSNQVSNNTSDCKKRYKDAKDRFGNKREAMR